MKITNFKSTLKKKPLVLFQQFFFHPYETRELVPEPNISMSSQNNFIKLLKYIFGLIVLLYYNLNFYYITHFSFKIYYVVHTIKQRS